MPRIDIDHLRTLIDHVVIVMLENRSFDHLLGHLSYGAHDTGTGVDGLRAPLEQPAYENLHAGRPYHPFEARDGRLPADPPHERDAVAEQLAWSAVRGTFTMSGFVEAYYRSTATNRTRTPEPMGFLLPRDVPITNFLATEFAVCDRWFAPLPSSTLPNRLMAWTGSSRVEHTGSILPPREQTVLGWLDAQGVPWRVYHDGLSFFALLGEFGRMLGPGFRQFDRLASDFRNERRFPKVVLVEPTYGDAPHLGTAHPNDNHPPTPVAPGEQFLRLIYRALTANAARWQRTVLLVTYDEHGGFFDHVAPAKVAYEPRPEAAYPAFASTGVRVPAIVASPLVAPGTVHHAVMDHTSILQFLGEMFGGGSYSRRVDARREQGITSVADVFGLAAPRADVPAAPTMPLRFEAVLEETQAVATPPQALFEAAALALLREDRTKARAKYPALGHWEAQRRPPA